LELGTWDFFGVWSLVFGVLRFGTSPELGVWCLVFRSAVAQKLRSAQGTDPSILSIV
jgi:hypothetical protein